MIRTKLLTTLFIVLSIAAVPAAAAASPRWFQPVVQLPASVVHGFQCRIYRESRSTFAHPNLGDNNAQGSSGVFQIEQLTWAAHQAAAHVPVDVHVWQASPYQQALVAVAIWRADGFAPWSGDGC